MKPNAWAVSSPARTSGQAVSGKECGTRALTTVRSGVLLALGGEPYCGKALGDTGDAGVGWEHKAVLRCQSSTLSEASSLD